MPVFFALVPLSFLAHNLTSVKQSISLEEAEAESFRRAIN